MSTEREPTGAALSGRGSESAGNPVMPDMPPVPDFPAIERQTLARWEAERTFARSLERTAGGPRWTFYEGPPTANGMPGAHHVEARVFKDLFPRFMTMRGYHVPRKAGWDCHGLPVEVAVESELGLSGKPDIEAYGVAAFNARCRESVLRHVDAFAALTRRMGYWTDLSDAYRTMDPAYVESVWWAVKTIYDQGLLVREQRVSPHCPRCGTPLSDHELSQPGVHREVTGPSVTARFPVTRVPDGAGRHLAGASLLAWTAAPWTLLAAVAVAAHPDVTYVIARKTGDGDRVVVAECLYARVLGEGWHVLETVTGKELAGTVCASPFGGEGPVVTGTFVTADAAGTGLVPLAPACGRQHLAAARAHGLPAVNPVGPDGRLGDDAPLAGGRLFSDADRPVIEDLGERGLLFASRPHTREAEHCWRCGTALLHRAQPAWVVRTSAVAARLLAESERANRRPGSVRDGRPGEWPRAAGDWVLSRTRYWGTPLPLWECPSGHVTCVGSLAELGTLADQDLSELDPHRPGVDAVIFGCPACGAPASRVPEVIDAWFDSGCMPFAQWGAPLRGQTAFGEAYPAQFICEAADQARGWFYSLMAVGTLVFGRSAYENALCLGMVLDPSGRPMSARLGNVTEPLGLMNASGADAVRWFFAVSGSPRDARRIGPDSLDEVTRTVLLAWWDAVSFLAGRAGAAGWAPSAAASAPRVADRPPLDRWLLTRAGACARKVTDALEEFDTAAAGRRLTALIDDIASVYLPRTRSRFPGFPGDLPTDGAAAFATLHSVLVTLTQLMAPFTPFLADYLWRVLRPDADSVHLSDWPSGPPEA
ncbi:MAG: isoleucine--tRNA ligase [Streptosporangiales bacterium]|nr:isoleucine--tRNA ligase [Streptosporangiales bacterium]